MRANCKGCYWEDDCGETHGCEDYTPINEHSDYEAELLIEERRFFYTREWSKYMRRVDKTAYVSVVELEKGAEV